MQPLWILQSRPKHIEKQLTDIKICGMLKAGSCVCGLKSIICVLYTFREGGIACIKENASGGVWMTGKPKATTEKWQDVESHYLHIHTNSFLPSLLAARYR